MVKIIGIVLALLFFTPFAPFLPSSSSGSGLWFAFPLVSLGTFELPVPLRHLALGALLAGEATTVLGS